VADLLIYVRFVHFAATILVAGVVFSAAVVSNPAARLAGGRTHPPADVKGWNRLLAWCALVLAVISGAGWLFLTAAAMSGQKLVDVLPSGALWIVLTETIFGHAVVIRLGLAVALAVIFLPLFSPRGRNPVWLDCTAAFVAAAFAGGVAWGGHAAGGQTCCIWLPRRPGLERSRRLPSCWR
jgi:putative copper export protein